jgi:putative DNA primase/helicase
LQLPASFQPVNDSAGTSEFGYAPTEKELRARKVPARVSESILRGTNPQKDDPNLSEDERSKSRDALVVRTLLDRSFTEAEILSIFKNNPAGCGDYFRNRRAGDRYLLKIIESAHAEIREGVRAAACRADMLPSGYFLDDKRAVWFESIVERAGGNETKRVFVSKSPLRITEIRENVDTGLISIVISYEYLGKSRSNVIPRSQMCNTRSLVAALSGDGAPVNSNNARLMVSYLEAYEHEFADLIPRKKTTSKFGRSAENGKFLLPGLMANVDFEPDGSGDIAIYRAFSARKGTLPGWVEVMNSVARDGFMIPQVAVIASFVPPLQKPLQIPNFILDIFGKTSSGKSTTLKLAASVFGSPFDPDSLIHQWMNTKIAVEQIAGMCSELPIYLDDAQHCSNELKRNLVYMIANGKGKGRSSGHGGLRETLTWRTVALSTSEESLHESSAHEGVRSRLLSVGGFVAPFPQNSGTLVQTLEKGIVVNHGFAGEAFVRHLNGWNASDWAKWERRYQLLRRELAFNSSSDVVGRVGGYIAAIGVAGEIVCPLLGLNFKPDALAAWLVGHLQEQQSSQNMALLALRIIADYYLSNLAAFAGTKEYRASRGKSVLGVSKNGEYIGFTRTSLDAVFLKRRWNQNTILQKLSESRALLLTEADRYTKKVTFGGVKHRLVCIKWSALLPDAVDETG